jgi:hypothetical protein
VPPQKREAPPTIERTIHFYRAECGRGWRGRPHIFDPDPAQQKIGKLPFADGPTGRYLLGDDGNAICVWRGASDATLRFCQIRRTGLPQLEQAGMTSDLDIAADAGLLEPVHVVFFFRQHRRCGLQLLWPSFIQAQILYISSGKVRQCARAAAAIMV